MSKALYRRENELFLNLIRKLRNDAKLTQAECSSALGRPQSFVSDVERGVRRLDIIQLRDYCEVLGLSLPDFVVMLEEAIG